MTLRLLVAWNPKWIEMRKIISTQTLKMAIEAQIALILSTSRNIGLKILDCTIFILRWYQTIILALTIMLIVRITELLVIILIHLQKLTEYPRSRVAPMSSQPRKRVIVFIGTEVQQAPTPPFLKLDNYQSRKLSLLLKVNHPHSPNSS